jgi:hypothetical protein
MKKKEKKDLIYMSWTRVLRPVRYYLYTESHRGNQFRCRLRFMRWHLFLVLYGTIFSILVTVEKAILDFKFLSRERRRRTDVL